MFAAANREIKKMFKKGKATTLKAILAPTVKIIPKIFKTMNPDYRYRKFFFIDHLYSFIVYNLSQDIDSMRDIVSFIEDSPWLSSTIEVADVSRSSFSDANTNRNYKAFEQVFKLLYQFAAHILPGGIALTENVCILDGTLIRCVASMLWAKYKTKTNAIKGHLLFDLSKYIPESINITDGNGSERAILKNIIKKGITYVVDRGYNCYRLWDYIIDYGAYFVSRPFKDFCYELVAELKLSLNEIKQGVISDQVVKLGNKKHYQTRNKIRLITYLAEDGKIYKFISNRFDLSALEVCELYRLRWEIETFFKWLKAHLKVNKFIVRSENGVLIQMYSALITYLLLKIYAWKVYKTTELTKRIIRKIKANLFAGVKRAQYLELIEFLGTCKT